MILDGKILRDLFGHERIKPAIIRTSQRIVYNLQQLKQVVNRHDIITNSNLQGQIDFQITKISLKL